MIICRKEAGNDMTKQRNWEDNRSKEQFIMEIKILKKNLHKCFDQKRKTNMAVKCKDETRAALVCKEKSMYFFNDVNNSKPISRK